MLLRVTGVDGTVAWVGAEDVRLVLPAQEDKPKLPTEENGVAIIRPKAEIKASIVAFNTPGAEGIVIAEAPDVFGPRVNEALGADSPSYDIPPVTPADDYALGGSRNG